MARNLSEELSAWLAEKLAAVNMGKFLTFVDRYFLRGTV